MTVEEAIALVEKHLERGQLTKVQELVFRHAWEGQTYEAIAGKFDYDPGYIKDTGAALWRCISQAVGKKVTKQNLRGVMQQIVQQRSANPIAVLKPDLITLTRHNLPARDFQQLIGRERELAQLLAMLTPDAPHSCISIEGIGGIGKTTLALAVAYQSLSQSTALQNATAFDAIIFASAKQSRLTPQGEVPRLQPQRSLLDLLRMIACTLNRPEILWLDFAEQIEQIQASLAQQSTLLIVDNLETVADWQTIVGFLYDLPATVKVVLTSRRQSAFVSIQLAPLSAAASFALMQQQAAAKCLSLSAADQQTLYDFTSGVPAAIGYAIGQLAVGYPVQQLSPQRTFAVGDYAHFYFKRSMTLLQGSLPYHVLMALALFPSAATVDAIAEVVGGTQLADVITGLVQLQQLSLVSQHGDRYSLLELTREYALAELATHANFAQATRDRWVQWYLRFAQVYGGKDARDWQDYAPLEQEWDNLQAAIEYCIEHNRYDQVRQFWQQVNGYTQTQGRHRNRQSAWSLRLDWTDWLIQAAQQQQDWATVLAAIRDQGWTLTLLGQPRHLERADLLYEMAWALRQFGTDHLQIELAIDIAVLKIQQQQFSAAITWLQQANQLLDRAEMDDSTVVRLMVHLLYYQGEIHYKTRQYELAQALFQQALRQAQKIQWLRAIFLAQDWLADIAIHQGKFTIAQSWLEAGLNMATLKQDRCRAAFCQRSLAQLENARGNGAIAQEWATTAKQEFEQLGMLTEARETAVLLQTLAST